MVKRVREHLKAREPLARHLGQSPEEWITLDLFQKTDNLQAKGTRQEYFEPLFVAWNVIAYERFTPGSPSERTAARIMSEYASESPIRLSESQVGLIDALAEAVNIPRRRQQREIEIPQKYPDFDKWRSSQEYQDRVARARAVKSS